MNFTTYTIVLAVLLVLELAYFGVARRHGITDKPNERSSHTRVALRGGGIIFTIALWMWALVPLPSLVSGGATGPGIVTYPWMVMAVTMAAGVSFVDDIRSLPDSLRLAVQFAAMVLLLADAGLLSGSLLWWAPVALVVAVGATNIYNFMDGINGITGGYSLTVVASLAAINQQTPFVDERLLMVTALALAVFCFFNFRRRARCFAGDVGSIGIALIVLFGIGRLVAVTSDPTWIVLLAVYGVDGCLTIIHRIMLHEPLGQAHRKHAFQLMANELHIPHTTVSLLYMAMQAAVSAVAIWVVPDTPAARWGYLFGAVALLSVAYVAFMRRYYHLHEEYLKALEDKKREDTAKE